MAAVTDTSTRPPVAGRAPGRADSEVSTGAEALVATAMPPQIPMTASPAAASTDVARRGEPGVRMAR